MKKFVKDAPPAGGGIVVHDASGREWSVEDYRDRERIKSDERRAVQKYREEYETRKRLGINRRYRRQGRYVV